MLEPSGLSGQTLMSMHHGRQVVGRGHLGGGLGLAWTRGRALEVTIEGLEGAPLVMALVEAAVADARGPSHGHAAGQAAPLGRAPVLGLGVELLLGAVADHRGGAHAQVDLG